MDETYIKVGKTCKYLCRAVDKEGQTIEFMLSAKFATQPFRVPACRYGSYASSLKVVPTPAAGTCRA